MDLQIWRELGDISSPEYAKKMVQVRKKQEQEFFNAGFDKSMIELLLELELDLSDINKLLTEYPEEALTADFLDNYSQAKKNKFKNSKFYMENSKIWKPPESGKSSLVADSYRGSSDGYVDKLERLKSTSGLSSKHFGNNFNENRRDNRDYDRYRENRTYDRYRDDRNRDYHRNYRKDYRDDYRDKRDTHKEPYKDREYHRSDKYHRNDQRVSPNEFTRNNNRQRSNNHNYSNRGNNSSTSSSSAYPQLGTKRPIIPEVDSSINYKSDNSNPGLTVFKGNNNSSKRQKNSSGNSGNWQKLSEATPTENYTLV